MKLDPVSLFIKFDPTGWWEAQADRLDVEYDTQNLLDACGLIPGWVIEYCMDGDARIKGIQQWLDDCYGFGLYDIGKGGGKIDDGLVYSYPGDEPLRPLISVNLGDEGLFLMYQYGICAIPTPEGYFITRMD